MMATKTDAVPRSGWATTISSGHGHQPEGADEAREGEVLAPIAGHVGGQHEDERDLGELRRLQLERPMTNHARAPLRARARTVTASSSAVVTAKKNSAHSRRRR